MRLSVRFGHTGRPGAECVPRCVARRPLKMSAIWPTVPVEKSTTFGCPGRIASPQPQYNLILPLGVSPGSSMGSSPPVSLTGFACGSTFSCSDGASLLASGTACTASARLGLRLVRKVTSRKLPLPPQRVWPNWLSLDLPPNSAESGVSPPPPPPIIPPIMAPIPPGEVKVAMSTQACATGGLSAGRCWARAMPAGTVRAVVTRAVVRRCFIAASP